MAEPAQSLSESVIPFWRVPWEFAVHAVVGTLIFGIIAAVAALLSLGVSCLEVYPVRWLTTYHTDGVIIFGLKAGEYALFVADLALFFVFLWRTFKRTIKHL